MKILTKAILITAFALCGIAASATASISPALKPVNSPPQYCTASCSCGATLTHVTASLVKDFKLVAACGLEWRPGCGGQCDIDLTRTQISLDDYNKSGNLPHGEFFLRGSATLTGTLNFSPGPAGDVWFSPKENHIASPGTVLANMVGVLKLYADNPNDRFRVPPAFQSQCWSAIATIYVKDIRLLIGETDEAGAYPLAYELISISRFKAHGCG